MNIKRILLLGTLSFLVSTSGVSAQAGAGRRSGQGMHAQEGMMQGSGGPIRMIPRLQVFAPASLLDRAEEISLTDQQIEELNALVKSLSDVTVEANALHDEHGSAMRSALAEPKPDLNVVSQHFWAAHGSRGRLHWTEVESSLKAMNVLTAEQRLLIEGSD